MADSSTRTILVIQVACSLHAAEDSYARCIQMNFRLGSTDIAPAWLSKDTDLLTNNWDKRFA
jgi:hypothetical protein